jgi:hypothetical protein
VVVNSNNYTKNMQKDIKPIPILKPMINQVLVLPKWFDLNHKLINNVKYINNQNSVILGLENAKVREVLVKCIWQFIRKRV